MLKRQWIGREMSRQRREVRSVMVGDAKSKMEQITDITVVN